MALPEQLSEMPSRALRTLLTLGSATRPEIATRLGVTKQTISNAVLELESRNLIEAASVQRSRVGRSALRYELHREAGWVAGIDLGASRTRLAAARLDGRIVAQRESVNPAQTVLRDLPDQLERAAVALGGMASDLSETEGGLLGLVIALPRPIPVVRDLAGESLDEADGALLQALQAIAPAAIWTENDVNCGALAQLTVSPTPLPASVLYLHAGLGVGAALIAHGSLVRGSHGRAGEIAHLPAPFDSGGRTVEQALSAAGLLAAAGHSLAAPLVGSVDDLFASALLGDAAADAAIEGEAAGLATLIHQLAAFVDPDAVVLSGLIAGRADLLPRVVALCRRHGVTAPVVVDPLGGTATVIGATTLASTLVLAALAPSG